MSPKRRTFRLNAPTKPVFWSSLVFAAAGVFLTLIPGPPWLAYAWVLVIVGHAFLVAGVTMKGL